MLSAGAGLDLSAHTLTSFPWGSTAEGGQLDDHFTDVEAEAQKEETGDCAHLANCLEARKLCFPFLSTHAIASMMQTLQMQSSINCSKNPPGLPTTSKQKE